MKAGPLARETASKTEVIISPGISPITRLQLHSLRHRRYSALSAWQMRLPTQR
jgi:hypothetical protein